MSDTKSYRDHTITLNEYFTFTVEGPHFPESARSHYPSYVAAREAVDKRIAQDEAQTRERLSLPVMDQNAKLCVITGVHARNGTLLGVGNDVDTLYPRQPFITAAIAELKSLNERIQEVRKVLYTVGIRRSYSGDHAEMIEKVKNAHAKASATAAAYQHSLDTKDAEASASNVVTLPTTSK